MMIKFAKIVATVLISLSLLFATAFAQEEAAENKKPQALNINDVLSAANSGAAKDRKTNADREARFKAAKNKQQGRLNAMLGERARQEKISDQLDAAYAVNETKIEALQKELAKELGDLKELFGVIQQTASEAQEDYKTSIISAQFPTRATELQQMAAKMGNSNELISMDEIENLWFQLQNEMDQQGKIVKFTAPVSFKAGEEVDESGKAVALFEQAERPVTRIGVFNAVTDKDIATYQNDKGLVLLDRQMDSDFTSKSKKLQAANDGVTPFYVDPTKGGLISALVRKPTLFEKVQEGGAVGYLILVLGAIAAVIAIYKIVVLSGVSARVNKQAKDIRKPSLSNPLGRIIKVYQDNPESDSESMELKLAEAILKETPKLNSWLMFIKIIAVVAPLFGLLGTVTGMIQTFQAITLFGAGDPQMMAGGISQALVTTVLGLVVAIPTVFLHWLASRRATSIAEVLEENVTVMVAEQIEKGK